MPDIFDAGHAAKGNFGKRRRENVLEKRTENFFALRALFSVDRRVRDALRAGVRVRVRRAGCAALELPPFFL